MRNFENKIDNTAPLSSGILTAAEDNVRFNELENAVTTAGITLDPGNGPDVDLFMLAQALARYGAGGGEFYQDTGSANTYVLGLASGLSFVKPKAYFKGEVFVFYPGAKNSGASTFNANGRGAKKIFTYKGIALAGGELAASVLTCLVYDPTLDDGAGGARIAPWAQLQSLTWPPRITRVKLTTPGAYSWTVPAGVNRVKVKAWGAGGGGGFTTGGAPAGGGGGAFIEKDLDVTPGDTITGAVGASGLGGAASPSRNGLDGGDTTVIFSATTYTAGGGPGALNWASGNGDSPGGGVPAGNYDVGLYGEQGGIGMVLDGAVKVGGRGAASPGGGAGCEGGQGAPSAGAVPGGGGGGSANPSFAGGNGARGEVWFEYVL